MKRLQLLFLFICIGALCDDENIGDPLRSSAVGGDINAQFKLANEYFYGTEERKVNYTLAAHWYRKSAEAGVPEGQFNYGLCLDRGLGVEQDSYTAYLWYKKAADSGFMPARYNCAMTLLSGIPADGKKGTPGVNADKYEAMIILERLVTDKFQPAETELASLLLYSKSSNENDISRAFRILKGLENNNDDSGRVYRLLADCYYGGFGTGKDISKTIAYLEKAALLKDSEAQAKLAHFYEYGLHVTADKDKAFKLYKSAAMAGFPMAQLKYGDFIADGMEEGKGLSDAVEWYKLSAKGLCPQAFFKLGVLTKEGIGMDKNERLSAEYFFQAAKMGYARAQYNIACLYLEGKGVLEKDEEAAFYWFAEAAKSNDSMAQRQLAICYFEGKGVKKNPRLGMECLQMAAKNGDVIAIRMIEESRRNPW